MKQLILIRHGDALRSTMTDIDRTLTLLGEKQVAISAQYLKSYNIEHILCSPTKRTKQTLKIIQDNNGLSDNIVEFCNGIYSNSVEVLLSLVKHISNDNKTALIVGHNPSLLELAIMYDIEAENRWQNELSCGLKTAEVVVLEFADAEDWSNVVSGTGKIKDMFVPSWS